MITAHISLATALATTEGNFRPFFRELGAQLAGRLAGWDVDALRFEASYAENGCLFFILGDGVNRLAVKVEMQPFSAASAVVN